MSIQQKFCPMRPGDLHYVVSRIPLDVRTLMMRTTFSLFLGGGFIRAFIAREELPTFKTDLDLFGASVDSLKTFAQALVDMRPGAVLHESKNALTILSPPRAPVQLITRWLHNDPQALLRSFDFTVAQGVIWFGGKVWEGMISEDFYPDLAARRLVYVQPDRNEDAGGSLMRVRKFLKRGYTIHPISLGRVIARLISGIPKLKAVLSEDDASSEITRLLFEVDPNILIDGITPAEEIEAVDQQF